MNTIPAPSQPRPPDPVMLVILAGVAVMLLAAFTAGC